MAYWVQSSGSSTIRKYKLFYMDSDSDISSHGKLWL